MVLRTILLLATALVMTHTHAETALHELPAEHREAVAGAVAAALQASCTNREINCRAQPLPNGQLLVEAPADAQAEVAAVLKAIAERTPQTAQTTRTTLHYWAVLGTPNAADANQESLRPLEPVLNQLERLSGPIGFTIADKVALTIVPYGTAGISGRGAGLNVEQRTNQVSDTELSARVSLDYMPPTEEGAPSGAPRFVAVSLNVEMALERGEFLVLGERSVSADGQSLFYVVHWPESE